MSARRGTGITEVSVMAAVQVAVLRLAGAEDYGRVATSMMRLPCAPSEVATAVLPDKFLAATLTMTTGFIKSDINVIRAELVIIRHELVTSLKLLIAFPNRDYL